MVPKSYARALPAFMLVSALLTGGCAGTAARAPLVAAARPEAAAPAQTNSAPSANVALPGEVRPVAGCAPTEAPLDCDRRAILAMAGDFEVHFSFDETVVLASDYERHPPHRSGALERVIVVEDSAERIVLQHLLQVGDRVVKHWRQDWQFEQPDHWEYRGNGSFAAKARPAELVPGSWTQLVFDVNDAPRYAGSGRWNHRYGVATWTSDRSWRPLPRRDYSKRDDYQIINAENRHTITPNGWTHEQDNTKTVRGAGAADRTLVREFGFNEYRRVRGADLAAAQDYWLATAAFWREVRARWDRALADQSLQLGYAEDDDASRTALFGLAERFAKAPQQFDHRLLDAQFARLVGGAGDRPATVSNVPAPGLASQHPSIHRPE
jgi:hypothetical protein